jgi:ABC-type uncharacterized transport system permease subunit
VLGYVHTGGFDAERITNSIESLTEYRFGRSATEDEKSSPYVGISGIAVVGGLFGAGCAVATRILPVPPIAAGAAYGLGAWAASEAMYRRMAGRQQRWGFPPTRTTLSVLTLYGAAVAGLTHARR